MLIVFLLLFLGCCIFVPAFKSWNNMTGLALSVTTVGIISCTMLFCMAAGDFDLSVGSTLAMSGVVAVVVVNATQQCLAGYRRRHVRRCGRGIYQRLCHRPGFGINAARSPLWPPCRSSAASASSSPAAKRSASPTKISMHSAKPYFSPSHCRSGSAVGCWISLRPAAAQTTTFGRNTLAIGGNREAARLAGIAVKRTKIIIFTLQGLIAGFAGVIEASQMTSGQPTSGQGLELRVIAACVLGGVSLTGGIGTILSVIVGALIMGTVQNAMDLKNVPTFYQYVASGSILLAAVLVDRVKQRGN